MTDTVRLDSNKVGKWLADQHTPAAVIADYTTSEKAGVVIAGRGRRAVVDWDRVTYVHATFTADPWPQITGAGSGGVHRNGAELRTSVEALR